MQLKLALEACAKEVENFGVTFAKDEILKAEKVKGLFVFKGDKNSYKSKTVILHLE